MDRKAQWAGSGNIICLSQPKREMATLWLDKFLNDSQWLFLYESTDVGDDFACQHHVGNWGQRILTGVVIFKSDYRLYPGTSWKD